MTAITKTFISGLIAIGCTSWAFADTIVLRNGDLIDAIVSEITPTEIKYKKASRPDGPLYTCLKSEVLAINYDDGEKETFDVAPAQTTATPQTIALPPFNETANIESINGYKHDIHFVEDPQKKNARCCFGLFDVIDGSVFDDGAIKIGFLPGHYNQRATQWELTKTSRDNSKPNVNCFKGGMQIRLTNNTDVTLYVDLANTFFKRGSTAAPYYIPTAKSSSAGTSSGASVNLGALGLGGIASGINVGGNISHGSSTMVFNQRIVSIPPHSSILLDPMVFFPSDMTANENPYDFKAKRYYDFGWGWGIDAKSIDNIKIGEERDYSEDDSPMKWGFFLTYSTDEEFSDSRKLNSNFYLKRLIGYDHTSPSAAGNVWGKYNRLTPEFPSSIHTFLFAH